MNSKYIIDSKIFKAFCDENRLYILNLLKEEELCACKLIELTNIKQSRLSYHIKILIEAGVINVRCDSKWNYYSINKECNKHIIDLINKYII